MSPDILRLALHQTRHEAVEMKVPDADAILDKIQEICFGIRARDPLNAMLDKSGFW